MWRPTSMVEEQGALVGAKRKEIQRINNQALLN
jgi:hypothetical protein